MTMKARPPLSYQLLIVLLRSDPLIWRRCVVPGTMTLGKLHRVMQVVMGWANSHLHLFTVGETSYSDPQFELEDVLPSTRVKLEHLFPDRRGGMPLTLRYTYDLGDDWEHLIVVEGWANVPSGAAAIRCLHGARACPPEDCGGIGGFEDLLDILTDPQHPEHTRMRMWAGQEYDPARFDLAAVNQALARLR